MTGETDNDDVMSAEAFGLLLQDVLRDLPVKAEPFVKGLAFAVEDRAADGSGRLSDWTGRAYPAQLSQYWARPANVLEPLGRVILYREPILAAGPDTPRVLREVILRSIEGKLGVDAGALQQDVGDEHPFWTPDADAEADNTVEDPAAPEPGDELVDLAECELELMPASARDWFDDVEIAAVEKPEAEGDPARLADFPEPGDEPKALVLYARNILGRPEPADEIVRGILREAASRAGAL